MPDNHKTLPLPSEDSANTVAPNTQPALSIIRQKVAKLYDTEPDAVTEEQEIETTGAHSKHQLYMQALMSSGQNIADIQTAWHSYYQNLSDKEKHQVWQEFYANQAGSSNYLTYVKQPISKPVKSTVLPHMVHQPAAKVFASFDDTSTNTSPENSKTIQSIKKHLLNTVNSRGKLSKKHHFQSLLFGLAMGSLTIVILLFGFFNERFIAPFITPSQTISGTPIIIDPNNSDKVGPDPLIIIPKINVEIPVVYDVTSIDDKSLAEGLMRGVLHYPTTPKPGQNGNVVIVGHSSNNIFNRGKYKFAFVLLSRLQEGDTFMLNYSGQRYVYRVYTKKIVKPTDVAVLGPTDKLSTATLITCDPPGTAVNRLVVIGEQISPKPDNNLAVNPNPVAEQPSIVPGNAESLFHRLFGWILD